MKNYLIVLSCLMSIRAVGQVQPKKAATVSVILVAPVAAETDSVSWTEENYLNALCEKMQGLYPQYTTTTGQTIRSHVGLSKQLQISNGEQFSVFFPPSSRTDWSPQVIFAEDPRVFKVKDGEWIQEVKVVLYDNTASVMNGFSVLRSHYSGKAPDISQLMDGLGEAKRDLSSAPQVQEHAAMIRPVNRNGQIAVRAYLGAHLNLHLPKKDEDNPNIPNQYEQPQTHPSVNMFFSNHVSPALGVEMLFFQEQTAFSIGLEYNQETLTGEGENTLLNLYGQSASSERLTMRSKVFGIGYWSELAGGEAFWYIKGRLSFDSYSSVSEFTQLNVKAKYSSSVAPGLTFGATTFPKAMPFGLFGEIGMHFGSASLESLSSGDQSVDESFHLADSRFYLRVGLSFDRVF